MATRPYAILDVFTETALTGNPLAVVLDGAGLDGARMQAIAREFNLSETVFVCPPTDPRARAKVRIFTPSIEMPFAGHPVCGTAVLLGLKDGKGPQAFGLELVAGLTPCVTEATGDGVGRARFKSPGLPRVYEADVAAVAVAAALGLEPSTIGFARHHPSRHGVSLPMTFAPLASIEALGRIRVDPPMLTAATPPEHHALYAYAPDPEGGALSFRSRMFAPELGVVEDPATGSAAAAFAGVLMQFEKLGDGAHAAVLHQGVEMGRPSRIEMQMEIRAGALASVEIAGSAVLVAEGTLRV